MSKWKQKCLDLYNDDKLNWGLFNIDYISCCKKIDRGGGGSILKAESISGLILGLRTANGKLRYFVTTSLIGWVQAQNQPCLLLMTYGTLMQCLHCSLLEKIHLQNKDVRSLI